MNVLVDRYSTPTGKNKRGARRVIKQEIDYDDDVDSDSDNQLQGSDDMSCGCM